MVAFNFRYPVVIGVRVLGRSQRTNHVFAVSLPANSALESARFTGFFLHSCTRELALAYRSAANFGPHRILDQKGITSAYAIRVDYVPDYKRYAEAYLKRICIDRAEMLRADIIKSLKGAP